MVRTYVKSVSVNRAAISASLLPVIGAALKAGADIGKAAHEDTWSEWNDKPSASIEGPAQSNNGVTVKIMVESDGTWWEAVNFGSTSPGTETYMAIGPYNAFSKPGNPHSGDGSKEYDGVIGSRGDSTIEPRDFIGYVFENSGDAIIQAIIAGLT